MSIPPKINAERQELIVKGIELYNSDIRVVREVKHKRRGDRRPVCILDDDGTVITNQSLSGTIKEFSRKSRQHLAFVAQNTESEFDRMVTLTYPNVFPDNGTECKRHLGAFIQFLRRRKVTSYLWFMEWQRRGAPHFHVLIEGGNGIDRFNVSESWYNIVGSDDEKHLRAGTRIETGRSSRGLHRYAVKYAQKLQQKEVPKNFRDVGRLWGCSRNVYPKPFSTISVDSEESLSSLLREWKHAGREGDYSILFNASEVVVELFKSLGIELPQDAIYSK